MGEIRSMVIIINTNIPAEPNFEYVSNFLTDKLDVAIGSGLTMLWTGVIQNIQTLLFFDRRAF